MTILSLLMWLPYAILIFVRLTTYIMESLSLVQQTRWSVSLCLLFYANKLVNPIGRIYTRDELSVRRIIRLSINPKTNFAP